MSSAAQASPDWHDVATALFPQGHDIVQHGDYLAGTGQCGPHAVTVMGTTRHAEVGIEVTLAMARAVLDAVRSHPGRALLFLMDTQGQRLRHRDELLGLNSYMAHLGKCIEVARRRGHRTIGLVYDQALSGGFIASAMGADICAALPSAEIRVMGFPAMSRVTRIDETRLRELAKTSPVFAPGAINYVRMGALESLWDGDLAARLHEALTSEALTTETPAREARTTGPPTISAPGRAAAADLRSQLGFQRGGRMLAATVAQRVAGDG